ncbi:hypothetical protein A3I40_02675 [Candidatus Uhrbacteria bacterium RIFCSPLOWO2_02_FULL_48_12]|uniref:Tyrosine recombinase XerC n=1 Tax=Candidatus Uhrbacteria bacterium RIFCSPLOWO2_02_FULL_48_12 TaxID=1802407 RepID=A0A1F7V765_9BACT|nr:MAG: hypothetical protein A3I40_02675 [Candidatus Uhrbacteria bacterium RIFCSPLOWO2_02_FULL_48_12]
METGLNLKTYLHEFLEHLEIEKNRSRATIQNYRFYLERFTGWASEHRATKPGHITAELIRQYRLWLNRLTDARGEPLKKNTQNYHLIAIRSWLKYLAKRDVPTLAAEKIELMKTPERQVEFLDGDDLRRLLNAPTKIDEPEIIQKRDQAILGTLFSTGLRVSELANLKIENINLEKPPKDMLTEFTVRGKGRKLRVVFLSADARELLKSYTVLRRDVSPYLFIRHDRARKKQTEREKKEGGAPLTPRSIERTVKKYAKVAGITKKVSPHTLRHSYATDLLQGGADIRSVQALLGHASITTTQVYTHITDPHLREVHKTFHNRKKG